MSERLMLLLVTTAATLRGEERSRFLWEGLEEECRGCGGV